MHLLPSAEEQCGTDVGGVQRMDELDRISRRAAGEYKALTYQRITVGLTHDRLDGFGLRDIDPGKLVSMDAVDQIGNFPAHRPGDRERTSQMDRLGGFFL